MMQDNWIKLRSPRSSQKVLRKQSVKDSKSGVKSFIFRVADSIALGVPKPYMLLHSYGASEVP